MERWSDYYVEYVAHAFAQVVHEGGVDAVTMRRVAAVNRCSPSTLVQRFGSRRGMLAAVADFVGRKVLATSGYDAAGFVDGHALQEQWLRAWSVLLELARADERLAHVVARTTERRLFLLERRCEQALDPVQLTTLAALVDGLNGRVLTPGDPMTAAEAREVVSRYLDDVR